MSYIWLSKTPIPDTFLERGGGGRAIVSPPSSLHGGGREMSSKPPSLISRDFLFQVFLFNFLFSSCFLFLVWSFIYLFSFIFLLLVWNFIYYFASFQNCCQWENIGTIDGKGVYSHCALQYDEDHFVFMGRKF